MNRIIIAILIPIVALIGWVSIIEYNISSGLLVRMRVRGYDPRDLLSGHYLNFTLDMGESTPCRSSDYSKNSSTQYCSCINLDYEGVYYTPSWGGLCSERPDCITYLKGRCEGGRFVVGVEQYMIPEKFAPVLSTVPDHSSVVLSVKSNGSAIVIKFLVEEDDIERYAERRLWEGEQSR